MGYLVISIGFVRFQMVSKVGFSFIYSNPIRLGSHRILLVLGLGMLLRCVLLITFRSYTHWLLSLCVPLSIRPLA